MKLKEVYLLNNGNTFACDEFGKQLPKFQTNWFLLFVSYLKNLGVNTAKIKFTLPNNINVEYFKEDNTYKILEK